MDMLIVEKIIFKENILGDKCLLLKVSYLRNSLAVKWLGL